MHTTYHLKANELNDHFLESIKALFQDQVIEISVSDIPLQTPAPSVETPRKAGLLKGRIKISDDFNAPLPDFAEYQ